MAIWNKNVASSCTETGPDHRKSMERCFLGHGDGLGDPKSEVQVPATDVLHNPTCQRLLNFSTLGGACSSDYQWAKHSRLKRADGKEATLCAGED